MRLTFFALAAALALASCGTNRQPGPYRDYGRPAAHEKMCREKQPGYELFCPKAGAAK